MNSLKKNSARKASGSKPLNLFGLSNFQGLIKEEIPEPVMRERGSSFSKRGGGAADTSQFTNEIFVDSGQKPHRETMSRDNSIITGGFKFEAISTSIKRDQENYKERSDVKNENLQKQSTTAFKKVFWRPQSITLDKPGAENEGCEPERESHRAPLSYTSRFNIIKPNNDGLANLNEEKKYLENTKNLRSTTTLYEDTNEGSEGTEHFITNPLTWNTKDCQVTTRDTKDNLARDFIRETRDYRSTTRDLNNEFSNERKKKIYDAQNLQKSFEISQNLLSQQLQVINDPRTTSTVATNPKTHSTERDLSRLDSVESRNSTMLKMVPLSHRETLLYVVENRLLQPSFGLNSLKESVSNVDERWHESLLRKCKRAIGIMKEEGKSLQHILEKRGKILKTKEELLKSIEAQRGKIQLLQKTSRRKTFEIETKLEMEKLHERLENIEDLLNETETLITIILMGNSEDQTRHLPHYSEIKGVDVYAQSTSLFAEYHKWMKTIDSQVTEYKRVYKLDFNSEDFQQKAQILVSMLKESEEFLNEARNSTTRMNVVMVVELKHLCDIIRNESNKMQETYLDIEESFDLVNQLAFIRKKKISEYQASLTRIKSAVSTIQSPFNTVPIKAANNKIFGELIESLLSLLKEIKLRKKEVKAHRSDPKTQYFMALRLKQTMKILDEMKGIEKSGESMLIFVRFSRDNLAKLEEKYLILNTKSDLMVNQAHALIRGENFSSQELKKLKTLYQEITNVIIENSIIKEEFEEKVRSHSFVNFSSGVDNLLSSISGSLDKLYRIQEHMVPFMKYDLSKYDQAKQETKYILDESEKFLNYLKENEEVFYNFDQTKKLEDSTNKIQKFLFRISGDLLRLRDKIKMDRISTDLTCLYEKVELENKNFHALKTLFEDNNYFASGNFENLSFEEDKENFEILDQILEMVGVDLVSNYKKNIFSVETLSPVIKNSASKIYDLAMFLRELIEQWMEFDKEFRRMMQNKETISKYREILESLYHSLLARIAAFDVDKTFKNFFTVFQERLEIYYKGVHNFIDNQNPYAVGKAIKWLTLNSNKFLEKNYMQKLDELFKYIERHPSENDERERLEILLNMLSEKFAEPETINKLLNCDIETIDSNLIPGYENMLKGKEDITKFLSICALNYKLFSGFVELYKESNKWNFTFTFNDLGFFELFKKQKSFFQKEYKGLLSEMDLLVPQISSEDFRKIVETRLSECQSYFSQLLEKYSIIQESELEFASCLLENSMSFNQKLDEHLENVTKTVGGDIALTKQKLDSFKEFLGFFDENSGLSKSLFDENIVKNQNLEGSDVKKLERKILFFEFIKGFELVQELRKTFETDVWIPFISLLCSHVDAKKERKVRVTRLVVRKELEDKIKTNPQRSELLQLFQEKV